MQHFGNPDTVSLLKNSLENLHKACRILYDTLDEIQTHLSFSIDEVPIRSMSAKCDLESQLRKHLEAISTAALEALSQAKYYSTIVDMTTAYEVSIQHILSNADVNGDLPNYD